MPIYVSENSLVEEGADIADNCRIWHWAHVRSGAKIGHNCIISKGVFVDSGVVIGKDCKIQNHVSIYKGVTIEDGVFVGPHVCFTNDKNPRAISPDGNIKSGTDWTIAETLVETGASIGANATIVAGITLGKWCLVGSGAVVTKSVPPFALALGNPAKVCGIVSRKGQVIAKEYKVGVYQLDGEVIEIK